MVLRIESRPSVVSMVGQPKTMEYFLFFPLDCIFLGLRAHSKGQLISKYFLVSSILPKKMNKKLDLTTMIPHVVLFLFVFWKN